jgi:cation:H+ antiporter
VGALVLLAIAGDRFITRMTTLSVAFRVRPVIVGTLVGGLGTSIPELMVVPLAVRRGESSLAIGTVVGSVVANIALGLALAALVRPLRVHSETIRREVPISVAAVALFALATVGGVGRLEGCALVAAGVAACWILRRNARGAGPEDTLNAEVIEFAGDRPEPKRIALSVLGALALMVLAAEALVRSATSIADRLGWSEGVVGLTLVAVGTSAPLIASGIQAARRGEEDIVIGNVLGGNMFIALIGGGMVGLSQVGDPARVAGAPVFVAVLLATLAWLFMARGGRLTRPEAVILILIFLGFLPYAGR